MFNSKKIEGLVGKFKELKTAHNNLTEDFHKLSKSHDLLIEHLNLIEKYQNMPFPLEKKLICYEPIKKCKTCGNKL